MERIVTSLIRLAQNLPSLRMTPVRAAVIKARARLETAVADHTANAERSRTISIIELASLTMATGDPDEATDIGAVAVGRAAGLKSMRAAEDVHELNSYARRAGVDLTQAGAE